MISSLFSNEVIRVILIMSLSGALLALMLLAIKPMVIHRLQKSTQYALWLVALASFLIPVSGVIAIPIATPVYFLADAAIPPAPPETYIWLGPDVVLPNDIFAAVSENETQSFDFRAVALYIYLIIAAAIFLYSVASYFYYNKKLRNSPALALPSELFTLETLKERQHPRIYRSALAKTPILTGLFKPTIVLPDRDYTDEALNFILLHELTHMRQYDTIIKWLTVMACALHWFNPVVWLLRKEIDQIAELACDEKMLRHMENDEKQQYGEVLISLADNNKIAAAILAINCHEGKKALKKRLLGIMKSKKPTGVSRACSALIIFAAVLIAGFLGSAYASPFLNPPLILDVPALAPGQSFVSGRSRQYVAVFDNGQWIPIQNLGDENFVPPAKVEISFIGTLDEIKHWAKGLSLYIHDISGIPPNDISASVFLVLDFYDINNVPTARQVKQAPLLFDTENEVRFIGTQKEAWELGIADILKPLDLYPYFLPLYDSQPFRLRPPAPLMLPPYINADEITYAEFITQGSTEQLAAFWGYTEAEVLEIVLPHLGISAEEFADFLPSSFFMVTEFLDGNRNLIWRHISTGAGDPPPPPDGVMFFRNYDAFEDWHALNPRDSP